MSAFSLRDHDVLMLDMDGTLCNNVPLLCRSWQAALDELYPGIRPDFTYDEIAGCMGTPLDAIVRQLFPMLESAQCEKMLQLLTKKDAEFLNAEGPSAYPAVRETLAELSKHMPVCIVSNCECGYIERFTDRFDLGGIVTDLECHGNTGLSKAENIRLVAERHGYRHVCYVGDTELDRLSAREAGASFVFAAYGFGTVEECDAEIQSFAELLELWR